MDLSTTNKFSLKVDFGDISKTDVKWESLERALAISKVNLDHEIFQELKQKKRTSMCIVLESLACKKDGTLDETSDLKGTMNSNIICMPCYEQNTLAYTNYFACEITLLRKSLCARTQIKSRKRNKNYKAQQR